jgi:undecaprenyl-diphosphatase
MGFGKAIVIGAVQVFALPPGISRDGMVTVTGMFRGLSRQDAVRYFSKARSLAPVAIYCLIAGLGSLAWFAIR